MMNLHYVLPFAALGLLWQQAEPSAEQPAKQTQTAPVEASPVLEITPGLTQGQALAPHLVQVPKDIDLALCLDTSGSMDGLLDSARQRLWSLVNDLALAEPTPKLRVALLTFGTPGYGEDTGFVRTALPLTEDLDMVSMRLFELTTNGGDEFVARVTQAATSGLAWSEDPNALKMIVVAGNESAEQDPTVTLETACGAAIEKNIVVHALYCDETGQGQSRAQTALSNSAAVQHASTGVAPAAPLPVQPLSDIALGWKKVSTLADGAFAMIQTANGAPVIETPFDTVLMKLSTDLNATYIPYGSGSAWNFSNQVAQDFNASGLNNDAAASRAVSKAGKLYNCSWDLLDSLSNSTLKLEDIDREQLPEALRSLSEAELQVHVDEQLEARKKIQADVMATGKKRNEWLANKRLELGTDEASAFDTPLRKAFRQLAEARGFKFQVPKVAVAPAPAPAPEESPVLEVSPAPGK